MAVKAAKEGICSVITQSKIPPEISFPHDVPGGLSAKQTVLGEFDRLRRSPRELSVVEISS